MLPASADLQAARELAATCERLTEQIGRVVIGQKAAVEQILIALFARGHCLLVGVPGLAKTLLVSTVSKILQLSFRRIQFTPDLMPSDITGTDILQDDPETGRRRLIFLPGPIFANLILADEINRTPPKTQAALLEAMQEQSVTSGGQTRPLPNPFFVLATQNPIEQEGTYPLPEAQQDRFMFHIRMDYPSRADEIEIVRATTAGRVADPAPMLDAKQILRMQEIVRQVVVGEHIFGYAADLVRATRPGESSPKFVRELVSWGAGPRASQFLILGGKVRAILRGRLHVTTEDIQEIAPPVLRHRVMPSFNAEADGIDIEQIVRRVIESVAVPTASAKDEPTGSPSPKSRRNG